MKGSCLQETMQRALQITSRVTPSRTPMPIIQNTLIRMMEKAVEFTATNLEMTVRMRIPADVEREGALTVPNKLLSDLVHTLPREPVSMEQTEETAVMRIKCGSAKANINGTNADLFPPIPEVEENNTVVITAEEFRKAVARVAFCAATDNGRPVLTGVLMEFGRGDADDGGSRRVPAGTPAQQSGKTADRKRKSDRAGPDAAGSATNSRQRRTTGGDHDTGLREQHQVPGGIRGTRRHRSGDHVAAGRRELTSLRDADTPGPAEPGSLQPGRPLPDRPKGGDLRPGQQPHGAIRDQPQAR